MRRPLEDRYWTTVAVVIAALAPYIVVTTAFFLVAKQQAADLHASPTALQISEGLSNAGYAFGALLGGDLIQRFRQRRLFFVFALPLAAGFLVSATATGLVQYACGHVLQGLATGFLLVVAVPPLVQRFAHLEDALDDRDDQHRILRRRLRRAGGRRRRRSRGRLALVRGRARRSRPSGVALALPTLPETEPPNRGLRFDGGAIVLGLASTVLAFLAVSRLQEISFASAFFVALLSGGVVGLLALLVLEYRSDEPLSPVKPLSSAIPTVGMLAATIGGGAFVTLVLLGGRYLDTVVRHSPIEVSIDFLPQVGGVIVAAALLGALVRTRFLPHLTLAGMVALIAAGALLARLGPSSPRAAVLLLTALLGLGAGASVSPGLWIAGMSLPVALVGRTFALVELVRSLGDYVLAPVLGKVAHLYGAADALHGLRVAAWATVAVAAAGTAIGLALWWAAGAAAQEPDLEAWQDDGESAFHSPRELARFRGEPEPQ